MGDGTDEALMRRRDIVFRLARRDDVADLAALSEAAYARWIPAIGRRPAPMDDPFQSRVTAGAAHVADTPKDGGSLALAASVIAWPRTSVLEADVKARGPHLYIWSLAVAPARQGEGYGAAALAFAVERARRLGLPAVELVTNAAMAQNAAWYERAGFVEIGRGQSADGFSRISYRKPL